MSPKRSAESKSSIPEPATSPTPETAPRPPEAALPASPTTDPDTTPDPTTKPRRKRRYRLDSHSPQVKAEAILALWTERRKPAAICRELAITWNQLDAWQDRALTAMLQALQPRQAAEEAPLTRPLAKLFERKGLKAKPPVDPKLQQRLRQVQAKEN